MKIYIASDIFTQKRKDIVNKNAKLLRALGHEVYVPHEHEIKDGRLLPNKEWAKKVFEEDVRNIDECNTLYYICEGMSGDIGAAWECGYAYGKGKTVVVEELNPEGKISLMVANCCNHEIMGYQS